MLPRVIPPPAAQRAPMVRWYDPPQLVRTSIDVVVSTLFGRHSDARLLEALATREDPPAPFTYGPDPAGDGTFWLDYVADTGDGWNSTYAIAKAVSEPALALPGAAGKPVSTRRGQVLVFGGDEVYPVAARDAYQIRLEDAFRTASAGAAGVPPDVYAIPGNHDWYDSLVAFSRLFCIGRRFGTGCTRQRRSYFALQLPSQWWLLGVDVQLDSDLDGQQVSYFRNIIEQHMHGEARIILCTAEPHWVYAATYGPQKGYDESNLAFLENELIRDRGKILVFIAGDLHHYQRYENSATGVQKITAGGGGAFLHPTHGPQPQVLPGGFERRFSYPTEPQSRRLCWRNLLFPLLNPSFGLVTALLYLLTAWIVPLDLAGLRSGDSVAATLAREILPRPAVVFWLALVVLVFVLFTDTHMAWYRWIAGGLHGTAHLAAALGAKWAAAALTAALASSPLARLLLVDALIFGFGWLVGSWIMGTYLLISLNGFHRHANEAFSALHIPDFKNFVRFCIAPDGVLHIFVFGIDRVPRRWRELRTDHAAPTLVPDDPRATPPRLIERVTLIPDMAHRCAEVHASPSSRPSGPNRRRLEAER